MTDTEKREAARQFYQKWVGKGKEDEDDRSYWIDILTRIMDLDNVTDHIEFQKKVIVDGNTKRIDAYIPETRVLIEQKTLGIALDKAGHQSGGILLTPYEQAKRYNDNLPFEEKARWIVTSNFNEIWIYDMNMRVPEPVKIEIANLQSQYSILDFLVEEKTDSINLEMEISLQAGELVGKMYDSFQQQYKEPDSPDTLKSLNKLCVRIVFCLYAEDAGIFGKRGMFHDYLKQFSANTARKGLRELFKVLDQKPEERDSYLADDDPLLAAFPYVNGGLFADEAIEIPPFTDKLLHMILDNASDDFDWSMISPTIFGAVFESTLNPETRRSGGMHYTSIENIHKVIDPLFLDDLKAELEEIKAIVVRRNKDKKLKEFQTKLASLSWLDPACGSGNFLTETYISIRRLENEVLKELQQGQMTLGYDNISPIQVSISQFYGIEINDFAVTVAQTALWIAESQMMKETEDIVLMDLDFLPLKTNAFIVEGNALQIDWEEVVPKTNLNYIMGNPPFVGAKMMSEDQKKEATNIFGKIKLANSLDYVCAWYYKAAEYIENVQTRCAFVSTNSICQGEQAAACWKPLVTKHKIVINFAYTTFIWDSEASQKAKVHCVIIGFSNTPTKKCTLYNGNSEKEVAKINSYLLPGDMIFIEKRSKPISDVPEMCFGNMPVDNGNYIFTKEEMNDFVKAEPQSAKFFKKYVGATEFLNRTNRYCLWLKDISPAELKQCPNVLARIENVKNFRLSSSAKPTREKASIPYLFFHIAHPDKDYLIVPKTTSGRRLYVPIGYETPDTIASDLVNIVKDASLYTFGILSSNVHNSWIRVVAGRLKSDFRYTNGVVYNTFPWPKPTEEQKRKIEQTAKDILDIRSKYSESSLADLYDPRTMPVDLIKAHQQNNRAVMQAYGFSIKDTTEESCVSELMQLYQQKTSKL